MEPKPQIDLNRYRNHQRKFPWGLVRKLIIGIATVLLLYYFTQQMAEANEKKEDEKPNEIEVEIDNQY